MLSSKNPTSLVSWQKLAEHYQENKHVHLKSYFSSDPERTRKFGLDMGNMHLDYSKNHLTDETLDLLVSLAKEAGLKEAIHQMFQGEIINGREGRAVLHTALRSKATEVKTEGENVMPLIVDQLARVKEIADQIQQGKWMGHTGESIKQIVNIGIGGSDLGVQMICKALRPYWKGVTPYFLSNIDGAQWEEIKSQINPEETLFVIASKTFTTDETMTNARTVREWFIDQMGGDEGVFRHFVAISTNIEAANEFGIPSENILAFWDWVGGRFSVWSAIGLTIACTVGFKNFEELLTGASKMDDHFREAEFDKNMPVVMALITIWQVNFMRLSTHAILPYDHGLRDFPRFLQQLIMESNGKQVDRSGKRVSYATCPVYFGEAGTNGQHAFYQLLHQGTEMIPADFIAVARPGHEHEEHHLKLLANCFAQSEALMDGEESGDPYKSFEGNRPSNTLLIDQLTPKSLGSLIALYEHIAFVQGIIWNIYSFDQWGVELGKKLTKGIINEELSTNPSTIDLIEKVTAISQSTDYK